MSSDLSLSLGKCEVGSVGALSYGKRREIVFDGDLRESRTIAVVFLPRVGLSLIVLIEVLQIAIPFGWLGLVGGISFLEAPLKFRAPNITLALGLGIGKLVFFWLNKVEIALAAVLLVLFFIVKPDQNLVFALFGVILLLLTLQTVWLLPLLNARSVAVISENFAASSKAHFIFIAFEVIKFISLFALGTAMANNHLKHG